MRPFFNYYHFHLFRNIIIVLKVAYCTQNNVMRKVRLLCGFLLLFITSNAQINQGQWLIGGNASLVSGNHGQPSLNNENYTAFNLSPVIGYFISDRFAGGVRIIFSKMHPVYSSTGLPSVFHSNSVSPFLRYYFLEIGQMVNIFIDGAYVRTWVFTSPVDVKSKFNGFSIRGGTEVFLNQYVGIEVALGYYHETLEGGSYLTNEFQSEVGFNFHFGKK